MYSRNLIVGVALATLLACTGETPDPQDTGGDTGDTNDTGGEAVETVQASATFDGERTADATLLVIPAWWDDGDVEVLDLGEVAAAVPLDAATVSFELEVPASDDFDTLELGDAVGSGVGFVVVAIDDANASGGHDPGEAILGVSDEVFVYAPSLLDSLGEDADGDGWAWVTFGNWAYQPTYHELDAALPVSDIARRGSWTVGGSIDASVAPDRVALFSLHTATAADFDPFPDAAAHATWSLVVDDAPDASRMQALPGIHPAVQLGLEEVAAWSDADSDMTWDHPDDDIVAWACYDGAPAAFTWIDLDDSIPSAVAMIPFVYYADAFDTHVRLGWNFGTYATDPHYSIVLTDVAEPDQLVLSDDDCTNVRSF